MKAKRSENFIMRLSQKERDRLDRLAAERETTKSAVIRTALLRLEQEEE